MAFLVLGYDVVSIDEERCSSLEGIPLWSLGPCSWAAADSSLGCYGL